MNVINAYLQSFATVLNKGFVAPLFFWFLWLIPIVILLYLLKLRRTQVVIASTLLWLKSMQDLTANAPFQRLRRNLLLLLQILVLLAVITAMARPYVRSEGSAGRNLCLLIDRSASMQTREGDRSRLDWAKEEAIRIINEMQRGDKVMLATFAESSDVLCELTDDRARLRQLVNNIQAVDTRTRVRDAFMVAHSLRLRVSDLHAVILSDGKIGDLDEIGPRTFGEVRGVSETSTEARARGYDLTFMQIGTETRNAGIVAFSVREPNAGEPGDRQTFVLVRNAGSEPLESTVTLSLDGTTLAVEEITAPPGKDREIVFSHGELGDGVLLAQLDVEDALEVDNEAWLSLRPAAKIRVLIVADPEAAGTYFLRRVLTPDPRVELSTLSPANYSPSDDFDLTVFYNFAPETVPAGTLLYINALPKMEGLSQDGTIENAPVIATEPQHPLMRFNLNPGNVGIAKAMRLTLPPGAPAVVSTTGSALVADVSRDGRQIAIVSFDIAESDWPLNLSFPLFFQNVLAWVPRSALASEQSVPAGRPLTLVARPEVSTATVKTPAGNVETVALDPLRPVFFDGTKEAGVYEVTYGEESERFAVNLLDPTESVIAPSDALRIGKGEFEAERGRVRQNHELWRWFLVVGIALLALEWWVFTRRAWI